MRLEDTIGMMTSDDYKERFKAEYWQLRIRQRKLHDLLVKYKAGVLDFVPTCPYELLFEQLQHMGRYSLMLEARAKLEGIEL